MEENTIRNQKKTYYKKKYRRRRRNRGVAIAEKYANEKWVKRQKTTFSGFVYYYLGRIRDQIFLFFHPSDFFKYKTKKEFEKYDFNSPEQLMHGLAVGCGADLSVGCIYFYAIIIIVVAIVIILVAAYW